MKTTLMLVTAFLGIVSAARSEEPPRIEVPRLINMQSLIYDKDGNLTNSEKVDLTFRIVDEKNNVLYTEVQTKIPVVHSAVNVTIGEQARGIPLEAVDPTTGPKFLDVLVDGTDPFDLMPFTSVPYAMWAEKALTVRDDSITTKQIKNGTIRPEDLDPAFSFANVSGQAADGQIPGTISRMIDLTNHINAPVGHQAIQIGVNQNFATFVANNVQQALEKIDQKLRDEIDNRKGGVDFTYKGLKKEVGDRGFEDGKIRGELKAHALLKTGVHGLTSTDPTSAIVGTTEKQTLTQKTLESAVLVTPKVAGSGLSTGKAILKYGGKTPEDRTFTIPERSTDDEIVTLGAKQELKEKTLTSPVITGGSFSGTLAKDTVDTASIKGSAITSDKIKDGTITTADIGSTAGITDAQVSDILTASIFKASSSKTGAVDLDTDEVAGLLPLNKIASDPTTTKALFAGGVTGPGYRAIADDDVPNDITINLAKTATTAASLTANGSNCAAGQYARGVDASGNAENCTAAATGTVTSIATGSGLKGGPVTTSGTLEVDYSKLNEKYVQKDSSGKFIVTKDQVPQFMRPAAFGTVTIDCAGPIDLTNAYNVTAGSPVIVATAGTIGVRMNFVSGVAAPYTILVAGFRSGDLESGARSSSDRDSGGFTILGSPPGVCVAGKSMTIDFAVFKN